MSSMMVEESKGSVRQLGDIYFSIIIPTLNDERSLQRTMKSLEAQTFKNFEVIVADGGSKDRTTEIARRSGARVVTFSSPSVPAQVNGAARIAVGKVICIMYGDVVYPNFWLEHIHSVFNKNPNIVATTASIYPDVGSPLWFKLEYAFYNALRRILISIPRPFGLALTSAPTICVFRREFWRVGGYDNVSIMEDGLFGRKIARLGKVAMLRCCVYHSSRKATIL
jgi:glycosyltransferase involved in cell wall biosynthesis